MTFATMLEQMSTGMLRTVGIFALTLIFSMPLGMLVAFARMSKNRIIKNIARIYISVLRGTPLMLQLLVVYFAPFYIWGANIGGYRFAAVIIGFALNYAAYFAEIYRGGIESIPKGQYEAAAVLGYTKSQTFVRIVLPQVAKNIMPAVTNEVITLVKDTSLAFTLAYQEVFTIGKQIAAAQTSFMPFVIAGVFYYIANAVVAFVMEIFEKKMNYYR
ncbi:MAG: amino acid ABC transporter permease [Firmicutes bacterium]|nr:amino acid ABC transporter permease [Clostridiales bacterium]MBQ4340338.1 amino acid ABC transporter permease [Bacillota bacterium]